MKGGSRGGSRGGSKGRSKSGSNRKSSGGGYGPYDNSATSHYVTLTTLFIMFCIPIL